MGLGETPSARVELENWGFRWRGAIGAALLVPLGILVLLSRPFDNGQVWPEVAWELVAWPVFLAGAVLRLWPTLYIGGRKRKVVVDDGPYSLCRNPLYLGTALLAASAGLFLGSILFTAGAVGVAAFYAFITVPVEERCLRENLGEPYIEYCRNVPRFWPRLSGFRTPSRIVIDVDALHHESRGILGWGWIPLVCHILVQARAEAWWPHLF